MTQATRRRAAPKTATVVRTERLSPTMIRVVFGGADLVDFEPSDCTDSYVKLWFLQPGIDYPRPLDLDRIRAEVLPEHWPVARTYTVRNFDVVARELTIDFVLHGDSGIAGPWAARARPGDELLVDGPGGGYAPDPQAVFYLYLGDESALPAIAAALGALPADAAGQALIEVHDASSELPLAAPPGVAVSWVHAGDRPVGRALVEATRLLQFPAASVDAFVHGEAGFVKELRRLLRVERGVPKEHLSISGYWRIGATEEGWRAGKAEWNRQADEVEKAAGLA
ncbi:NADPH-dependent ferric siderophore reductase, contains FAD-binding and SIP domains [Nakamurella panacisegetis]|uniref:NADPH-dependent ferric siderophore reductase, contains FAD-binding and SIP domains n=1 Tax=Nakamurella panacisegetis TaxID=1090615 RepID=A0A1H0MSS1_9ACTN|nr:siderophore-interacting protein [Nakamurella panacisegetis]SDO83463.1 NADPH-dependent ferric siderophore reductase, contains FAD-binding and SIP domains [Nakamurella panacisegetis]